jgi:hypothetical protein
MSPELISRRPVWRSAVALAVALLLASHAAVALAATQPYGGESPEAVVERMRAAAESEDLGEMAACLSPDDRATLSLTMVMMTGMVMAFAAMGAEMGEGMAEGMAEAFEDEEMSDEERAAAKAERDAEKAKATAEIEQMTKQFEALVAKHGLEEAMADDSDMDDADPAEVLAGVDQVALLQDLMGFLENLPGESEEGDDGEDGPVDVPEGELSGLVIDGSTAHGLIGDEEVDFVEVDGRWYLSLDLMEQMRQDVGETMDAEEEMEMEMETDSGEAEESEAALEDGSDG